MSGGGLLAVTLRYPYEVRDDASYFRDIEDLSLPREMKELALHIVDRMKGRFDPSKIEDRYKKALGELLASKASAPVAESVRDAPAKARAVDLVEALRASVAVDAKPGNRRK
jgi:DNA end-binding protein Ku